MDFKQIKQNAQSAIHTLGAKKLLLIVVIACVIFALDQAIKLAFIAGFNFECEAFTLGNAQVYNALVYNTGVAFSLFAFIGEWLKYIQVALILVLFAFTLFGGLLHQHPVAFGLIFGAGMSNIFDRFIREGVVDYVYWHYGFDWAIFNFADVMIDLGVGIIVIQMLLARKKPHTT